MDTQGRRYQVFLQERAGAVHQDVGSVHAVDSEMALQNGRDVFVRRPECVSLWVAPVEAIFSRTRQELEQEPLAPVQPAAGPRGSPEAYAVFIKPKSAGAMTFTGTVQACSPVEAMQAALQEFQKDPPVFTWWVLPVRSIVQTQPDEVETLFEPARDKPFRESGYFRVVTAMRQARQTVESEGSDDACPV